MLHYFKGITPNPPNVLLVGSGSKAVNPHTALAPAKRKEENPKGSIKTPAPHPKTARAFFQSQITINRRLTQ
jgi:hypothetical protein